MKFLNKDINHIENNGLTTEKVNAQIERIKFGMVYSNLIEAGTIERGILKVEEKKQQDFISVFEEKRSQLSIVKFVPASGAATRMFKFLYQFLKDSSLTKDVSVFLNGLEKFPFFEDVINKSQVLNPKFDGLINGESAVEFIKTMLDENRLNFGFYPKGLFPFHKYKTEAVTAFKEHLFEAALYASANSIANLHFTISEDHKSMFDEELKHIKDDVEQKTNVKFDIAFSYQSKSTNTIALTLNNDPYRTGDGNLLFRPSGHGALIDNLNTLDFDLIFIKNIDNIVVYDKSKKVSDYKKLIAGILLEIQDKAFKYLRLLDGELISEDLITKIELFLSSKMNVVIDSSYKSATLKEKVAYLYRKLNRPIRVCGMVKNEGEPGGGPFWVKDESGNVALQIIEFAQIDIENKIQKEIVANATHFNPVDIVCGIKDYKGVKFNLLQFVDDNAAFVSQKSQSGVDIKVLELPGLWNGSMAYWNTIFVEIPVFTFNPVKTVNDLLKPAHQV